MSSHFLENYLEKPTLEQFSRHSHEIETMEEKYELELLNNFFFSSNLHRILAPDYLPTSMDIVHMRKATIGVHEFAFEFKKYAIRLIDVGGQRTERRKWIHFFEDVTAVMFVASLSSYDQIMEEDMKLVQVIATGVKPYHAIIRPRTSNANPPKNRLMDSIDLFNDIVKNEFLKTCSFILFLNKVDLFKAKLEHSQLADYFKSYTGDNDYSSAAEYIQNCFQKARLPSTNKLYVHYTEATDTQQIDFVFAAACDIILQANLARAGMQ
ncbi:g-protein alpha subunit [Ancylostoma ceylanicum]|uniref:G-protein alpha subunit n=1 Tax=Ancylostoma ceylanicum TaxID=53326 RepID=A0A0D6LUB1_9BILA|nr:g-protein alpha subunit [Ancylostoma ceylanicum]